MEELLGRMVVSTKGRDKGKRYVVIEIIDSYFVRVADGTKKLVSAGKRKNKHHIALTECTDKITMDWTDSRQGDDRIDKFLSIANKEG